LTAPSKVSIRNTNPFLSFGVSLLILTFSKLSPLAVWCRRVTGCW
jgi:hypothetical protein